MEVFSLLRAVRFFFLFEEGDHLSFLRREASLPLRREVFLIALRREVFSLFKKRGFLCCLTREGFWFFDKIREGFSSLARNVFLIFTKDLFFSA